MKKSHHTKFYLFDTNSSVQHLYSDLDTKSHLHLQYAVVDTKIDERITSGWMPGDEAAKTDTRIIINKGEGEGERDQYTTNHYRAT
jgi:hypothetical protein